MKGKKSNRIAIIIVVVVAAILAIVIKLFGLTIIKGDYYRDLSDNKKIKEIDKIAPRGNIYDRNGEILATSTPSFTIQLYKDDIANMDAKKRNEVLEKLSLILENDGVNYTQDFAISLDSFSYKDNDDYFKEKKNPDEKVIDILLNNNLLYDFINSSVKTDDINYSVANTAIYALRKKGIDLPIIASVDEDGNSSLEFKDEKNLEDTLNDLSIDLNSNPSNAMVKVINNDKSVIRNILDNPLARKALYKILEENGLTDNIVLKDYELKNDKNYIETKSDLAKIYPEITKDSTAKDDFYNIVKESSVKTLLQIASLNEDGSYLVPADMIIEALEEKGVYANFSTEINTENNNNENSYTVSIEYKAPDTGDPVESLVDLAIKNDVLYDIITDENVKYLSQKANTMENIYPSIDVSEWLYTDQKEKIDLYEKHDLLKEQKVTEDEQNESSKLKLLKDVSPEEIFNAIKEDNEIKNSNKYISNGVISIINKLNSQGNYGYRPVSLVYNLNENTIAKVEENIDPNLGIMVDTVPVRYYPNRNSSSHILGYMGKIATDREVKEYIEEGNYLPDEFIGKTGIEESYENVLKGTNGKTLVSVDSRGNRKETISEKDAVAGEDLYLSIDSNLQQAAEESLSKLLNTLQTGGVYESKYGNFSPLDYTPNAESGAVVVTDVKTGEVLSMVSLPDYDPNLFSTGISETDWNSLQANDESGPLAPRPMLNIASQTAVQPGSTFKLVSSYAALQKGLDPHKTNLCEGFFDIGNKRFSCLIWSTEGKTHGEENLYDAIRDSCNYYFYTLALGKNPKSSTGLDIKLELDDLRQAAKELGLDRTTGIEINVPQEVKGNIPSVSKKLETTKSLLASFLREYLRDYLKKDEKKSDSELEKDIDKIVSWADSEDEISRDDIIDQLDEMGYDPLEPIEDQVSGLADTIKYSYLNQANWDITDMLNIVIGQGQNSYTPLQMNRMISTIANGGNLNKYTLVSKIKDHNSGELLFENQPKSEKIDLKDETYLEDIKYGTLQVAESNGILNKLPIDIGVKTGTAEVEGKNEDGSDYDSYSWMVGYAPYDDPQIAVSVLITQGGSSYNCSPVMRDVVATYMDLKQSELNNDN